MAVALRFLPVGTGSTAPTMSVAEGTLSGNGVSDESDNVFMRFLAIACDVVLMVCDVRRKQVEVQVVRRRK